MNTLAPWIHTAANRGSACRLYPAIYPGQGVGLRYELPAVAVSQPRPATRSKWRGCRRTSSHGSVWDLKPCTKRK